MILVIFIIACKSSQDRKLVTINYCWLQLRFTFDFAVLIQNEASLVHVDLQLKSSLSAEVCEECLFDLYV